MTTLNPHINIGIEGKAFPQETMANAGKNLLEGLNQSESYAKLRYETRFDHLFFHDPNPSDNVPLYLRNVQKICVQFKDKTFYSLGEISLKRANWKLKDADEMSAEINQLIDDDLNCELPALEDVSGMILTF